MTPVLILTYDNMELTKACVESVQKQDVKTSIGIVDNGSTDGTLEWLSNNRIPSVGFGNNRGVSVGWNVGLSLAFTSHDRVLVLNNDAVLPPWFLSELLSYDVPFVTGVATDKMPTSCPEKVPLVPHPDFSAFLIRRDCWETVGMFDERMKIYCSDCDYHIRGYRLGVPMMKANVPYFHINSQTIKRADVLTKLKIERQAHADREAFKSIYGCLPGTAEYASLFRGEYA